MTHTIESLTEANKALIAFSATLEKQAYDKGVDESAAAIAALQSELAAKDATLKEHQTLTDQGMAAAGPLIAKIQDGTATDEDKATLSYIFSRFALYSSNRAAALKAKEKAELEAQKADLEAKLAAL